MEVMLLKNRVKVEIVRKNNKNIYFRFKDDGVLYVTCNYLTLDMQIKKLIKLNEKSLAKMYENSIKRQNDEIQFSYLGDKLTKVFDESVKKVVIEDGMIYAKDEKMLDRWYKKQCEIIFEERIEKCLCDFNDIPKFTLKIRSMKTRWGVNNVTKRIITLNSELLKKDVTLIDYVIIHELCHFYEANHSNRFWVQVEKRYPYYKLARKRLRTE